MILPSSRASAYLGQVLAWLMTLTCLFIISQFNYLLFHTLAELFSILVAGGIFAFTWNTRHLSRNYCMILLGVAYLGVAGLDFFHLLTFPGISIIAAASTNTSAQFWVSARFIEALALCLAPLFLTRSLSINWSVTLVLAITGLILSIILFWPVFPRCYLPGQGLTHFKIGMEIIICGLLFLSLVHLFAKRSFVDRQVLTLLTVSIGLTISAEILFTLYNQATGTPNLFGHLLKVLSFYFIYRAIIVTGLIRPYTYLNMTVLKKEQDLQQSEERYRQIIEDQKEIICRFNNKGQLIFANQPFCNFFGLDSCEPKNLSFQSLFLSHDQANLDSILKEITPSEPIQEYRHKISSHDGRQVWLQWSIHGIANDPNEISEYQAVARDITELQNTLAELDNLKQKAERANKAKDVFLANMSHEMRTPLNAILGLTALCLEEDLPTKQHKWLKYIQTSAESLLGIIEDLLDLSKIEVGELRIQNKPFNLIEFTDSIIGEMSFMAREKGLELELVRDQLLTEDVVGDALRLRQILRNLIINAIKFTEKGTIQLQVSSSNPDQPSLSGHSQKADILFQVADSGPGIRPEDQDKLFEPFSTIDQENRPNDGGSGLGLTICKRIVEHLGGQIRVWSEPGRGSTFSVRLPLGIHTDQLPSKPSSLSETSRQDQAEKLRVLLVEDQFMNRIYMEDAIQRLGHTVHVAQNGQEALQVLEAEQFDLVFMDIRMPVMDGLTATREIRKKESINNNSRVFIIGLSANADPENLQEYLQTGMDDYLIKPVDPETIRQTIQKHGFKRQ